MILSLNNTLQNINSSHNETPLTTLPLEIFQILFSNLNLTSFEKTFQVSKEWNHAANLSVQTAGKNIIYKEIAIRNETWRALGAYELLKDEDDEEEFSSLPSNIFDKLKNKTEPHLLFRLPKTFNLQVIGELFKKYFPDTENGYFCFVATNGDDIVINKSRWLLLKKQRIVETEGKEFDFQQTIATKLSIRIPYVIEVATAMLGEFSRSKKHLFFEQEIRCLDTSADSCQRTIKSSEKGLTVSFDIFADEDIGITGLEELSS